MLKVLGVRRLVLEWLMLRVVRVCGARLTLVDCDGLIGYCE